MQKCFFVTGLALLAIVAAAQPIRFAFFQKTFSSEFQCEDIPEGSIVLALGFEHLGEKNGTIDPGAGNIYLAEALAKCVGRLSIVLTQKAISDALQQNGWLVDDKLMGQTPVLQMHLHRPDSPIRTFQALQLALDKLQPLPDTIVLLAHDKQIERARADLASIYKGKILVWQMNDVPYADNAWHTPLRWSMRELYIARPVDIFWRSFYQFQ